MFRHRLKAAALAVAILALAGADEPVKVEFPGWFSNPVFRTDGKTLVFARMESLPSGARTAPTQIVVWDVAGRKETRRQEGPADDSLLGQVAESPDGKRLALVLWNTAVRLWDLEAGKELARLEQSQGATHLQFTPDGRTLGWLRDDAIHLTDLSGKKSRQFGKEEGVRLTTLAFADGGKVVLCGQLRATDAGRPGEGKNRSFKYEIGYWAHAAEGGKKLYQVGETVSETRPRFSGSPAHELFVSADGKKVFLVGERGSLQVCDAATGKKTRDVPVPWKSAADDPVRKLALSGDGKVAALATARGVVAVWDLAAGKELRRVETGQSLDHVALSPDGKALAVSHQTPGRVGAVLLIWGPAD
jgi:WD40 repeat protein